MATFILCLFAVAAIFADVSFKHKRGDYMDYSGFISFVVVLVFMLFSASYGIINVPGDQPTIQAGIDAAVNGDTVLVADGTYTENINFKGKAITVASHFIMDGDTSHINNTVIDGSQPSNPDSGSVVFFISGEDTTSVICGFTITGGSGTKTQYDWGGSPATAGAGGGILCNNAAARISHNNITNNSITQYVNIFWYVGGGVATFSADSSDHVIIDANQIVNNSITGSHSYGSAISLTSNGTIMNNYISGNTSDNAGQEARGAVACGTHPSQSRSVVIKDNMISHNQANGTTHTFAGGVCIEGGMSASIIANEISYNVVSGPQCFGGGITTRESYGTAIIDRNTISNNMIQDGGSVSHGGGICLDPRANSSTVITNNIISNNSAEEGGGIRIGGPFITDAEIEIVNNTIINNSGSIGGGINTNTNSAIVINTIVWGNQSPNISGSPDVTYSDVEGGFTGTGNIDADPLFMDTLSYDLSMSSPCISAGIDSIAPPLDFDGDPRPNPSSCMPDIGAQESPECLVMGIFVLDSEMPGVFSLKQNYPNPFNPTTNIQFSIPKSEFVALKVYNILGEEVATLVSEKLSAGKYKYEWNAGKLASGVYLYRLETESLSKTKKLVLLK